MPGYNPTDAFIVAAVRTPIGKYGGSLSSFSAVQLGSLAIKHALSNCNVNPSSVDEVYFGNVLQANLGQAPARQASLAAGIPNSVPCTTVNKVCSSGMKSIQLAASSIRLGENNIIVCGGMESMSNVPYYVDANKLRLPNPPKNRPNMGNIPLIDGMLQDGLMDVYNGKHMGHCGEICSNKYNISREKQDNYSILSFKRANYAIQQNISKNEIVPIDIIDKRSKKVIKTVTTDEGCLDFDETKLRKLKPAFLRTKEGTVTAGNASQLSDGAAACVVVSGKYLNSLNADQRAKCIPLVQIVSYADAAKEPVEFTTAPSLAIPKALSLAGLNINDVVTNNNDYFEVNEAFSVVALANAKILSIPINRLNIFGGAVALGHPLGCSGARIIITLINALKHKNGRYGIAGICNGGGGASAMIIKNCSFDKNQAATRTTPQSKL